MADDVTYLPDIPEAESTEVDDQSSVLGLVYNGITPHTKRIKIEDVVKDVADDISDLSTTVSGLGDAVSSLQSTATTLSNDIDAEEAKTTALNSLYGVVTSLAGSVGLTISSTQDINNNYTAYSLNGNSADAYKPSDLSTWIRRIAQEIEGVTASKDASNVWSLPAYTTQVAMASTYSTDLRNKIDLENKQTNFDHSWTSSRSYSKDAVVIYNNQIYQCNTANSDSTFDSSKWTLIAAGGGGGISGTDFEIWKQLRNIVLEGITRELSPEYSWTNPADSIGSYANNTTDQGYWSNAAASTLGYQATADTSGSTLFDKNESYLYYQSNGSYYYAPGDSIYKNTNLQLRTNILKMLSTLMTEYKDFEERILYKIANDSALNPYNDIPIGTINNGSFDCYVAANKPTYTTGNNNEYILTSSATYNEKADLVKSLMDICAPKRITGIFRAANWATTETRGRINWCPLTDIDNPEHAHILHSAVYSDTDPAGDDYPDCSNSGLNYYFNDAIMDVYLPGIEYGTSETNNTLRKQILEAYNLIQDTNISYQPTWKASSQKTYQYDRVSNSGYDMIANYNNWSTGGDCGGIVAYIDPDEDVPIVDIPVQILIFPKFHDRTDYIQSNS